jgi:hypothetical protein
VAVELVSFETPRKLMGAQFQKHALIAFARQCQILLATLGPVMRQSKDEAWEASQQRRILSTAVASKDELE